nr:hypothetical protein [uncultured Undibacterium sp.]
MMFETEKITITSSELNKHVVSEFAQEYTPNERIRTLIVGITIGALIIVLGKLCVFPWLAEFAVSAPCQKLFGIDSVSIFWYCIFVGIPASINVLITIFFAWRAYKIIRDDQYPPAREKVYRPTRIRRSKAARLIAYAHLTAFLPLLVLSIWGNYQAQEMIANIPDKAKACTTTMPSVTK